jgi:hypothetical protein
LPVPADGSLPDQALTYVQRTLVEQHPACAGNFRLIQLAAPLMGSSLPRSLFTLGRIQPDRDP